jgi:cytochrome b
MAMSHANEGGRYGARTIAVWDPLVRSIHWGVAACILLNATVIDDESKLHTWLGYAAVSLVGVRLVWGLIARGYGHLSAFPLNPVAVIDHLRAMARGEKRLHLSHNPLGAVMVYNLWACIAAVAVTGYMMGTVSFFGVGWVHEVHEAVFYWLMVSVGLHVAGVVIDTVRTGVPLIPAMLHGRKKVPEGWTTE